MQIPTNIWFCVWPLDRDTSTNLSVMICLRCEISKCIWSEEIIVNINTDVPPSNRSMLHERIFGTLSA